MKCSSGLQEPEAILCSMGRAQSKNPHLKRTNLICLLSSTTANRIRVPSLTAREFAATDFLGKRFRDQLRICLGWLKI